MWIGLVIFYGFLKGIRDVLKKKALELNSVIEVLIIYTFLSFLIVSPGYGEAISMDMQYMPYVLLKSFAVFVGWLCGFKAIENMPVSLYGVTDMARVVFAAIISIFVFGEVATPFKIIGMLLVVLGLFMVNKTRPGSGKSCETKYLILALICCLGNAVSENLDKYLMTYLSSTQLQFWYMLLLVIFYSLYALIKRIRINIISSFKNIWIWLSAVSIVIGDRALFVACSYEDSSVIAMTLLKQCSVIFTIIGGGLFFREKDLLYRIVCAIVIIAGIAISLF